MRNNNIPTIETLECFTARDGKRWFSQIYYPNGKRDHRYWIITMTYVGAPDSDSIKCATLLQYDYEKAKLCRGQRPLFT